MMRKRAAGLFLAFSMAIGLIAPAQPVIAETDPAAAVPAESGAAITAEPEQGGSVIAEPEQGDPAMAEAAMERPGSEETAEPLPSFAEEASSAEDPLNGSENKAPELVSDDASQEETGVIRVDVSSRLYQSGSLDVRTPIPEADSLKGDTLMGSGADPGAGPDREGAEAALYTAIRNHEDSIDLTPYNLPLDEIPDLYVHVVNTNGDLFLAGDLIEIDPESGVLNLEYVDYWYPEEAQQVLDNTVDVILSGVDSRWSDEEKLIYIHDYLIDRSEYDYTYSRYSAYHLLVEHTAVCQGYAAAFNLLVKKLGISVDVITSYEINHAWNLVKVNGEYYYIDATWDDPSSAYDGPIVYCMHENFLRERDAFSKIHYDSTDWEDSDGNRVYTTVTTGNAYENAYWLTTDNGIRMSMAPLGRQWAYFNDGSDTLYIYDYISGANRDPIRLSYEYIYGAASDGKDWYIVTNKGVSRVTTAGEVTSIHSHTSAETNRYDPRGLEIVGDRAVWTWMGRSGGRWTPAAYGSCPIGNTSSSNGAESAQNTWSFSNGVLTITGTQNMTDRASADDVPWASYASQITKVVLEDGVTSVGAYAFANCVNLKTVEFGKTVAFIGDHAFDGCKSFTKFTIPDTVTEIGRYSFANTGIKSIEIPKNVTHIYGSSFGMIPTITVSEENGYFDVINGDIYGYKGEGYMTRQCLLLCNKTVPGEYEVDSGTTVIMTDAFACADIWSVILPDITWEIYPYAFGETVKNVIMPDTSEANDGPYFIRENAFKGFTGNIYYKGTEASQKEWQEAYYRPYSSSTPEPYIAENNSDFLGANWFFDYSLKGITTTEKLTIVTGEPHAALPVTYDPNKAAAVDTTVSYMAADPGIVRVDPDGTLTGLKGGNTTVYVRAAGRCAACLVTVVGEGVGVSGITVSPTTLTLVVGNSSRLQAVVSPSNATNTAVTWSSSKSSVAAVDASGNVTGKSAGTATITATTEDGGFKASCYVTVKAKTVSVTGISLDTTALDLNVGETWQLIYRVIPSNATNKSVTFKSSDPDIVSVDTDGILSARASGTARITLTTVDGGFTAVCDVTVEEEFVDVESLTVTPESLTLKTGESKTLKAEIKPDNATDKTVRWESSDPMVADVDANGKVTAIKAGVAEIIAYDYDGWCTDVCYVTVIKAPIHVEKIEVVPNSVTLEEGDWNPVEVIFTPSDADNQEVTWTSSDPTVADIDADGDIAAYKAGTAILTAKSVDGGKTATCKVTVIKAQDPDEPKERTYISLAGGNRYATGVEIAKAAFPTAPSGIVVVYGGDFPDALSANAYAGAKGWPVIMCRRTEVPSEVRTLLKTTWGKKVKEAAIIGGGFTDAMKAQLNDCGMTKITEIKGPGRRETAEEVCKAGMEEGLFTKDTVLVATGAKAADALAVSPWSYKLHYPILLTKTDATATPATKALIAEFDNVIMLGGPNVVSDSVLSSAQKSGKKYTRLAGDDRYETSLKIAEYFVNNKGGSYENTGFADGTNAHYPDALVGGMLQGQFGAPIILTKSNQSMVDDFVIDHMSGPATEDWTFYFLGAAAEGWPVYDELIEMIEW